MQRALLCCLALLFFGSCRKESEKDKVIAIQGTLLESSSHPVPVPGYTLSFFQGGNGGSPVGGASSSSSQCLTNADGHFQTQFRLGNAFFLFFPGTNVAPLSLSGANDTLLQPRWTGVTATSQTLPDLYLYKKVTRAVLQLQADTALLPSDTIEIYSQTTVGSYYRTITGRHIPAAVSTAFDTIANNVSTFYNLENGMYTSEIYVNIKNNGVKKSAYIGLEPAGDEETKTYLLVVH